MNPACLSTSSYNRLRPHLAGDCEPLAVDNPALDTVEAIADALLATLPPRFWLAGFSFVSFREPILSRAVEAETLASLQSTEATEATARAMIRSIDSAAWRR